VDRLSVEALRAQYPELAAMPLVAPDLLDDGEALATIDDASCDFIVANHFLEHCQDPIGTIERHLRKLRSTGRLFYAVPNCDHTFDRGRPATSFDHLLSDYRQGPEISHRAHLEEWARCVDRLSDPADVSRRVGELAQTGYSIHYHVWTRRAFREFLLGCERVLNRSFRVLELRRNGPEFVSVLQKA
jgi:SAM-dependent methyltransferase